MSCMPEEYVVHAVERWTLWRPTVVLLPTVILIIYSLLGTLGARFLGERRDNADRERAYSASPQM